MRPSYLKNIWGHKFLIKSVESLVNSVNRDRILKHSHTNSWLKHLIWITWLLIVS